MIQHQKYIIIGLSLNGDWYKPEQPEFGSQAQAFDWLKGQIASELLDYDHDYYLGKAMSCLDVKSRLHKDRTDGKRDTLPNSFTKVHPGQQP